MKFLAARGACCVRYLVGVWLASLVLAGPARAQIPSNERWRTIETEHFRVHFTPLLEREARHAASVAERAYANLATELVRPRGPIDLILSDATDASNGSATVIPRPLVVMYARPPVDEPSLESYDDWTVLVLQHEITHIFHLDRSRGWWRAAQAVFGRNPVLFPNYYTPSWLTEGLAVYYESRFTTGGRLNGSFEAAVARSAAVDHAIPPLGQLSLATSRFPYGQSVYVYGSFVWDDLAQRHGSASVPAFVEYASGVTIPFFLDREAKHTFGETFTHAWNHWRDSALTAVTDSAGFSSQSSPTVNSLASARGTELPGGGRYLIEPRWTSDTSLVYVANTGRETPGEYGMTLTGSRFRIARRNSLDVNSPSGDSLTVFAQGQYVDRFHTRGDLYVRRNGEESRLTDNARLSSPSVRADGEIVAVQTVPGSTRLVRVSASGRTITPLTTASLDTQWTAPRWSPDGGRIAAVRIAGAPNEIVVLDTTGLIVSVPVKEIAVLRSPVWSPDGRLLLFTSDHGGESQLRIVSPASGPASGSASGAAAAGTVRLTAEPGGVYGADAVRAGTDSVRIATTVLRGDGYHVKTWTVSGAILTQLASRATPRAERDESHLSDSRWRVADDTSAVRDYSPWRTLVPAYWSPTFAQEGAGRGNVVGALTGATDATGRHSYIARAGINTHNDHVDASLSYAYNRWANPLVSVFVQQSYSYSNIVGGAKKVGDLEERSRLASLHATISRPRVRTYVAATIGAELEERDYSTSPGSLLPRLIPFYSSTHHYPTAVAAAVFSNTQSPTLAISPEDGISITGSVRQRWEASVGAAGRSAVAIGAAYKSFDLPGFAHHVLAVRGAVGAADGRSPSEYSIGGVSGQSVEVVPGITFGTSPRTFPVRGFPAGAEVGIHAAAASVEYRVPLIAPSRSLGLFPFFLDRVSGSFFGDAARASCPVTDAPACSLAATDGPTLASVGAELNLDSALQFDVRYRFRLGVAHPVRGAAYGGASTVSVYTTLGLAF